MKTRRIFAFALCVLTLFSCFTAFSVNATEEENPVISWFTAGMTVAEAKEISPALKSFTRGGNTLEDNEAIASGDTVVTDNASYTAWVLGDVSKNGNVDQYSYILIKRHCFDTYTLDEQEFFSADIDKNGRVDQYDYILVKRMHFETYRATSEELGYADVNMDSFVDVYDYLLIARHYFGTYVIK